jgi:peptide/nickel transport system ATP-binding protein
MLAAERLSLALPNRAAKPLFGSAPLIPILKEIDLTLGAGESLGIVGESGAGKSSLARALVRLYRPTGGRLLFEGRDITALEESALRPLRARLQIIFQDPQSALNPRHRIGRILAQPLLAFGRVENGAAGRAAALRLLDRVGLPAGFADRYPHELSGGQRQRVGIARAIALEPAVVVADEIVSGLDVSTQAQILELLAELKRDLGLALIFISHDLSVVRVLCDRVLVLWRGEVVEQGGTAEIFRAPRHPYTRALLDAVPLPDVDPGWIERAADIDTLPTGEKRTMQIKGKAALVSGANRGLGRAFVAALLVAGATKVYAAARDPGGVADLVKAHGGKVVAVALDVTDEKAVAAAAKQCGDVAILINNAGINRLSGLLASKDMAAARAEMETNYFGTLAMCRAFAPVLKANGGGAIVNNLSILARVGIPAMGSYCASKAAGLLLSQGVRAELAGQGTLVTAVMPGAIDTDMSRDLPPPKAAPEDVAKQVLAAVEAGEEEVYPGEMAAGMAQGLAHDPKGLEKQLAQYLPG